MQYNTAITAPLRALWNWCLALLYPSSARTATLVRMNGGEFREAVGRPPAQPRAWILPLFPYTHPLVKTAVWEVKYRGNGSVVELVGALLAEDLLEWLADLAETENFRAPLLAPIPLSKKREKERGFNQCALLARAMARALGESVTLRLNLLEKTKETESQTKSKNRAERIKNLAGCFAPRAPEGVRGRNIVLIDDVTTTGATLVEARAALLRAGARKVVAITIAH